MNSMGMQLQYDFCLILARTTKRGLRRDRRARHGVSKRPKKRESDHDVAMTRNIATALNRRRCVPMRPVRDVQRRLHDHAVMLPVGVAPAASRRI